MTAPIEPIDLQDPGPASPIAAHGKSFQAACWTAREVLAATGGHWAAGRAAGPFWRAAGVCIALSEMRPGDMVAVRGADNTGVALARLGRAPFLPQALIVDAGTAASQLAALPPGAPVLVAPAIREAVAGLGVWARRHRSGKVVGVTGSAGKTTMVALIAHALRLWGVTGASRGSANMQMGIAWNLASMPGDAAFRVVEMAIGGMRANTAIARPDVAIVTNIAPAHLQYHRDVDEIARRKARIFEGMRPGAVAVLYMDMPQFALLERAARQAGLRVVSYGRATSADVRLTEYAGQQRMVSLSLRGRPIGFRMSAPGEHMALNAAGCVAVLDALGLPAEHAAPFFATFAPVAGRGVIRDLTVDGRVIRFVDESYNANPASMAAAIAMTRDLQPPAPGGRRLFVLGDMRELGPDSRRLHADLAGAVLDGRPDLVILCGEEMTSLRDALAGRTQTLWAADVTELAPLVRAELRSGDLVLVKSSAGTRLDRLAAALVAASARGASAGDAGCHDVSRDY